MDVDFHAKQCMFFIQQEAETILIGCSKLLSWKIFIYSHKMCTLSDMLNVNNAPLEALKDKRILKRALIGEQESCRRIGIFKVI